MKTAVISVTKAGDDIAEQLKNKLDIDLYSKENVKEFSLRQVTKKVMEEYKAVVFISSTGIAVRAIAEFIKTKDKDPAVLVIDSSGKFVISLLSGHLGGANELTLEISELLNSTPVITTATDNMGVTAPDMIAKDNELVIDSLKDAKDIAAL
jgi:cobalt-precorrin 5A hydrolase